ncbi:hypothetical protein [Hymenobacter rigui]|uniref:Uncharacterized protein n=1 Tax=Hymenobacter rigui TaxID=334424 RepID=A0A3R9MXT6_9BACT|nr:hypothetical protein [Hymenobacter rigui]RSK51108.1 hypothetical protein EI291_01980 [Hymenobacter rigui]
MTAYYQPSGRFTVGGVLAMILAGALAAFPLAFMYVYAIWYIPLLYVNFLVTLGLGLSIGWVLKRLARAGKLRNPALAGWLGFAVGLWTWYVQWCVYLTLLAGAGETEQVGSRMSFTHTTFQPEAFLHFLSDPVDVLSILPRLAADGTWSIFGVTVSGFFLYLVWLAEFLIINVLAAMLPNTQAATPFSELTQEWAEKTTLPQPAASFTDAAATKAALEAADWNHLQLLPQEDASATAPFSRLHFYQVPSDPECCYLSLENVTIELDNKGKTSEKTTDVVEYLRVPPRVCQELHTRFGAINAVKA